MIIARLRATLVAVAAALFLLGPLLPQQAEAQDRSRWRVLVANMKPADDTRDRFGERVSSHLRELINVPTHVAMPERDTDRAAREYDLRLRDLDCVTAMQLASQIDVPLVYCGEYRSENNQIQFTGKFITVPGGEEFEAGPHTVAERDDRAAAEYVMGEFEQMVQTVQNIAFCGSEYNSQNWDQALTYCSRAVELAPDSRDARFALARSQMELERYEESLENFQILLEESPRNDRYLQNAGWVAAQLEERDLAREYYHRYLDINPDDARVRINVAFELAQIGDYFGAMSLVEEGIERDPDNVNLHEHYGSYAFRAALERQQRGQMQPVQDSDAPSLDPEVAELFRAAAASLEKVVEARGSEARAQHVVNPMRAYIQLGEPEEALRLGERGVEIFPENAQIWSQLADARNRAGNVDGAIAALERVKELNPEFPNLRARIGRFYLEDDRVDEAIEAIREAEAAGEQSPDALAGILLRAGFAEGIQAGDFEKGLTLISAAQELNVSSEFYSQLAFFRAFGLMRRAERLQEPNTLESAERTLPMFQEAQRHLEEGRQYGEATPGANYEQIAEAIQRYIEIQEAIIARERRRR
jgi:tetratricopeptide (TPR) repeat protein